MKTPALPWTALLLAVACGGGQAEPTFADPDDPNYAAAQDGHTDSRISRSAGERGGTVVLWPRVIPSDGSEALRAQAAMVQARLQAFAEMDGYPVDVRPEPERACPRRGGCVGAAVGAALFHVRDQCGVVATTTLPGESPTHLERWAGEVEIREANVAFREPPEEHVQVRDLVPCDELGVALDGRDESIRASVRAIRQD